MTFLDVPSSLDWPAQLCAATMVATWIASLITGNVSQVDRLWTFLPNIYAAYYALLPLFPNEQPFFLYPYAPKSFGWTSATTFSPRAVLMLGLITLWMLRLSYNTWRRGLFNPNDEDYRWVVLRANTHPVVFQVINLGFIVIIQNVLLLLLGLPLRTAVSQPHTALETPDYVLAALALVILGLEFVSDNQQYAFHAFKLAELSKEKGKVGDSRGHAYNAAEHWMGARLNWTAGDAKRGFITRGLWKYSRHPNFFCEQSFWWIINLFPLMASAPPNFASVAELPNARTICVSLIYPHLWGTLADVMWIALSPVLVEILPAACLTILFYASSTFTESISKKKYPVAYAAYQQRVARFAPIGTIYKAAWLWIFGSEKETKRIERLVWGRGDSHEKTK